jgi:hypothetical protein
LWKEKANDAGAGEPVLGWMLWSKSLPGPPRPLAAGKPKHPSVASQPPEKSTSRPKNAWQSPKRAKNEYLCFCY